MEVAVEVQNTGSSPIVNALFPYLIDGVIFQSWNLYITPQGTVITLLSPLLPGNVSLFLLLLVLIHN